MDAFEIRVDSCMSVYIVIARHELSLIIVIVTSACEFIKFTFFLFVLFF